MLFYYMYYNAALLFLIHYVPYYAHEKSCACLILHQVSTINTYITKPLRPSLVYCLFPVAMFSKNRGRREVIIGH